MKKGTNQLFLYEIRHQPKRTKTNAWKVSIGHGHRWHSQSRSHHAVVNHEWLYARPVIDEGQQYGTDREIITISLLWTQPLILWIEDAQQTPQGLARAVPNAKRSRQLLLAKQHGLRSNRKYSMPSTLAEAV